MPENVFSDDLDWRIDEPGFRHRRMRLGRRLGAELLGASVFELPPGERLFAYHFHHANEELLVVLDGTVVVRTPHGEEELVRGDVVLFRRGPEGAHQAINRSAEPARLLIVSTMLDTDVAEYPDTGKLKVFGGRAPGAPPGGPGSLETMVRKDATVEYYEGEPRD